MRRRYNKKEAEAEAKERASELAKVAKIKAERERREQIDSEMKRLQVPRLMAIKGVRRLRPVVMQLDAASLSQRDHFLLETEDHLYHYKGEFAPFTSQRTRAVERAQEALQKERMVKLTLVSVKPDDVKEKAFWTALNGNKNSVGPGVGDNMWELKYNQVLKLYRYDAEVGLLPEGEVSCNLLEKKSIFVLAAPGELYVWYGKETGLLRRNQAKAQAVQVYNAKGDGETTNKWVQIREIRQGAEDYLFRQKFPDWIETSDQGVPLDPQMLLEIFSRKMLDFNPAKVTQIEDVNGQLDIWVAKDHGKVPISKVSYGEFFNGNSYIVLYQSGQGRVIYFWRGCKSHVSWEHAAESIKAVQKIALSSVDLLWRKKTTIPVVRVGEGDEPPHLLALFNGAFILRNGKFDSFDRQVVLMYHVRGTDAYSCRVAECPLSRMALRSSDAFLAYSPKVMFVWRGKDCNEFAYRVARALSERYIAIDIAKLVEGSETQEFWDFLGGKVEFKEMEKKRVNKRKCVKCANSNPVDLRFCRKCGAPMGEKKSPTTSGADSELSKSSGTDGGTEPDAAKSANPPTVVAPSTKQPVEDLASLVDRNSTRQLLPTVSSKSARRKSSRHANVKHCPKCAKKNPKDNRFCRGCGNELTDVKTETDDASQSESESGKATVSSLKRRSRRRSRSRSKSEKSSSSNPSTSQDESDKLKCSTCSKTNKAGMLFCKFCGNALSAPETPNSVRLKPISARRPSAPPSLLEAKQPSLSDSRSLLKAVVPIKREESAEERRLKYQGSLNDSRANLRQASPRKVPEPAPKKPVRICEFCQEENNVTSKVCISCSAPFEKKPKTPKPVRKPVVVEEPPKEPEKPTGVSMRKCPECAVLNELEFKFCLECGENLQEVPSIEVAPELAAVASETIVAVEEKAEGTIAPISIVPIPIAATSQVPAIIASSPMSQLNESTVIDEIQCKVCQTWNEHGCRFCADCGEALVTEQQQQTQSFEALPKPEKTETSASAVKCAKCRRPNAANLKFCRKCGWELAKSRRAAPSSGTSDLDSPAVSQKPKSPVGRKESLKVVPTEPAEAAEPSKDCRKCGRPNPVENVFCRKCGTRYSELGGAAVKSRNPAEEIAKLRMTNSSQMGATAVSPIKKMAARGIRCADPDCAKPNKPGDAHCRKCGKALPKPPADSGKGKDAAGASSTTPAAGAKIGGGGSVDDLKREQGVERLKSSQFLQKQNKSVLQDQVDGWLKKREELGSSSSAVREVGKLSMVQAKMKAMEEKAAAEKAKAEEDKRKAEEEAAALEARQWVQPKLFIIRDNAIHPKRCVLQVHLKDPESQVLLDDNNVVWVWSGSKTNAAQMAFTKDLAKFYTDVVLKESQRKAVIKEAKERAEPKEFVNLFQGWEYPVVASRQMHHSLLESSSNASMRVLPVSQIVSPGRASLGQSLPLAMVNLPPPDVLFKAGNGPKSGGGGGLLSARDNDARPNLARGSQSSLGATKEVLGMYSAFFPLASLQQPESLPPTLDQAHLELYLTDAEFFDTFTMTKDKFNSLPAWKKTGLKKNVGIF